MGLFVLWTVLCQSASAFKLCVEDLDPQVIEKGVLSQNLGIVAPPTCFQVRLKAIVGFLVGQSNRQCVAFMAVLWFLFLFI